MENIILINNSNIMSDKFKKQLNLLRILGFLKEFNLIKEETYKKSSIQIKKS